MTELFFKKIIAMAEMIIPQKGDRYGLNFFKNARYGLYLF